MKRIISLVLVLIIAFSSFGIVSFSAAEYDLIGCTYTVVGSIMPSGDAGIFGRAWDPTYVENDMTYDPDTGWCKITYENVPASGATADYDDTQYEYKVVMDYSWDHVFSHLGEDYGGSNASFDVDVDGSTVTIYFDGEKCWANVVPPESPTEDVTQDVADDKGAVYIKADDKYYQVEKGETYTYKYCLDVPDTKVASIDVSTTYDTTGLDFAPYTDEYGDCDVEAHWPVLLNVVFNLNIDGELYYNYTNVSGKRLQDNAVVFQGAFTVTADSGIYEIDTKIKAMSDTNMNTLVQGGEALYDFSENCEMDAPEVEKPTEPATQVVTEPTEVQTEAETQELTDAPTDAPSYIQTETPTEVETVDPDGLFIVADDVLYEVEKNKTYTYTYCLSVPDVKVSSLDIATFYDSNGLDFVPYKDSYGDDDVDKHWPNLPGVVYNYDIDGEIYYNFTSVAGKRLHNDAVVFTGEFKVTADSGVYTIDTRIHTLADSDMNKIVYIGEIMGEFTEKGVFDTTPVETPTEEPTVEPTEPPTDPTEDMTQEVTEPVTQEPTELLYIKADGVLYPVEKGKTYEYTYCVTVPDVKVSSFDACTVYDSNGLDFIPYKDSYGDIDTQAQWPALPSVVYNYNIDGEIYYNYSSVSGVRMYDNAVVFKGAFKVTADSGIYSINSSISTMADSDMNKIVYIGEVYGNYSDKGVLNTTPVDEPTEPPTQDSRGLFIEADGTLYEVEKGKTYTYTYYLSVPGVKVSSLDVRTYYDSTGLEFVPYKDSYGDDDVLAHWPNLLSVVYNLDIDGELYYNYSSVNGKRLENDAVVFVGDFTVTADSGVYSIDSMIHTMADSDMNKIVYVGEKLGEYTDKGVLNTDPYVDPTDKPTETQPTVPTQPITEETQGVFVRADGTLYEVEKGKTYTYTYYLSVPDVKVSGIDVAVFYDSDGLDFVPYKDSYGDDDVQAHWPTLLSVVYNLSIDGEIHYNYSSVSGKRLQDDAVVFVGDFTVTADSGIYDIDSVIDTMADTDMNAIVYGGEKIGEYTDKSTLNADTYVEPTDPTEEPTQPSEPTQPPTEPEHTYTVAGAIAPGHLDGGIFTVNWDPGYESNDLEYDYATGMWSITYTDVAATGETDDFDDTWYEYKIVQDHGWEVSFTEEGEVFGEVANAKFDVDVDGSTVTIWFDGTKCWAEVVAPQVPTEEPTSDDPEGLFVRVDGQLYPVVKGEKYRYTYYLTVPNKTGSFDASTYYDADGLKVSLLTDEYGDEDIEAMFPVFKGAIVYNLTGVEGEIAYNYSSTNGVRFTDERVAFTCDFEVTADSGVYDIFTIVRTITDTDMNMYVDYGQTLIDTWNGREEFSADPYIPTEPTEEPTEPPHVHVVETINGYPATCENTGLTDGAYCSKCFEILKDREVIPALGHTSVTDYGYAATCESTGLTNGAHCSVCDKVLTVQKTIPALGHTSVTDYGYAATCESTGLTNGAHCSVCDKILTVQKSIPALGHTSVTDYGYAATCVRTGLTNGAHCSVCDKVLIAQKTIPALGHSYSRTNIGATCTQEGYTKNECVNCDYWFKSNVVPALGHHEITEPDVPATCQSEGHTGRTYCDVCKLVLVESQVIEKTKHSIVCDNNGVPATCTESGLTDSYSCKFCGLVNVKQRLIQPLGHNYQKITGYPATDTDEGLTDGVGCLRCGEMLIEQTVIPAKNFMLGDVNGDKGITVMDATAVQRHIAKLIELTGREFKAGDTTKDGKISVMDATAIQRFIAKLITEF